MHYDKRGSAKPFKEHDTPDEGDIETYVALGEMRKREARGGGAPKSLVTRDRDPCVCNVGQTATPKHRVLRARVRTNVVCVCTDMISVL